MDIKEPVFDRPIGLGTTREKYVTDPTKIEIVEGLRVMLVYQGKNMLVEVTTVEEPNSKFAGRVLEFEDNSLEHGELRHGDLIRFGYDDLRWID